jgi:hypothetical protein
VNPAAGREVFFEEEGMTRDEISCPCKELERLRRALKAERECYVHNPTRAATAAIAHLEQQITELEEKFTYNESCCGCPECLERIR